MAALLIATLALAACSSGRTDREQRAKTTVTETSRGHAEIALGERALAAGDLAVARRAQS